MSDYKGIEDTYLPAIPKPSLQQYDNYGIYNIYCVDRPIDQLIFSESQYQQGGYPTSSSQLFESFLAVQAYDPAGININFDDIVNSYYAHPERFERIGDYTDPEIILVDGVRLYNSIEDFYDGILTTAGIAAYELVKQYPPLEIRFDPPTFTADRATSQFSIYRTPIHSVQFPLPPDHMSFIGGYIIDHRVQRKEKIKIIAPSTTTIQVTYYRSNPYEGINRLTSIDWFSWKLSVEEGESYWIDIQNAVMGTVQVTNENGLNVDWVINQIAATLTPPNTYPWSSYLFANIATLYAEWMAAYNNAVANVYVLNDDPNTFNLDKLRRCPRFHLTYLTNILRKIGANNNYWSNKTVVNVLDINEDSEHPMFLIDTYQEFNRHIRPQFDSDNNPNGIGDLIMDSPRTIEIHKALDAGKYAVNELSTGDPKEPRITTLGYLIDNIARVNGLRFDANGDIDLAKEKELYQPRTINKPTLGTPLPNGKYNKYGMSCFGTIGMLVPHLPTTYGKNGKQQELFDVVHDNQQLAIAILRQHDVSQSIQHGSEIRINGLDGKVHSYPNQLAVLLECLQRLEKIKYTSERNLLISTVTGTEVRELFSGIGIPVTQKFIPLKDPANSRKVLNLPYFGHQKNKPSTAQLLTTVQINLAVINGVLMPKKQPKSAKILNPFTAFKGEK